MPLQHHQLFMEKGLLKKKKILQIISVTVKMVTYKLKRLLEINFGCQKKL